MVASTADQANDAQYRDWSNSRRSGWPPPFGGSDALPPLAQNMQWAKGEPSHGISLIRIPGDAAFMHAAAWYPDHAAQAGLIVAHAESRWCLSYILPFAVHVDGLYLAELYIG